VARCVGPGTGSLALLVLLVGALLLDPMSPAVAQTLDDLDDARARVAELEADLDAATARYEDTWARIEAARVELDDLRRTAEDLEGQAADAERAMVERARQTFMHGSTSTFQTLLTSRGSQAAVERAGMVAALQRQDRGRLEEAVALRAALDQSVELVAAQEAELQLLQDQLEADAQALQASLAAAEADAERIGSLVARQQRIDRGPQQGIYACIFDPGRFRFRDTWGAPRSGGRSHRGTDVFAAMNEPTYAFTSGVILRHSNSRLGGLGLYLRGDDGNVYYYAHLNGFEPSGQVGTRVVAGELIARNGATGNADSWAPHVHFEVHPGGGAAINPFPWLAAACF
jgi:peptidoglycan LD-endopeptidase LytH